MKVLSIIFLFLFLEACATKPDHEENRAVKFKSTNFSSIVNNKKSAPSHTKIIKGKYNIEKEIKKILPKNWNKERWFLSIDNKNGYAEMGGYIEGSYKYYLFVGAKNNLLVNVTWGCGPACEQVIQFYVKSGSVYKKTNFEKVLSKGARAKLQSALDSCSSKGGFNSWSNKSCVTMLKFPVRGTDVEVFSKAEFLEDGKFQDKYGNEARKLTTLKWNKKTAQFEIK